MTKIKKKKCRRRKQTYVIARKKKHSLKITYIKLSKGTNFADHVFTSKTIMSTIYKQIEFLGNK